MISDFHLKVGGQQDWFAQCRCLNSISADEVSSCVYSQRLGLMLVSIFILFDRNIFWHQKWQTQWIMRSSFARPCYSQVVDVMHISLFQGCQLAHCQVLSSMSWYLLGSRVVYLLSLYRPDSWPNYSTFCLCIFSSSSNNTIVTAIIISHAAPSRTDSHLPDNRDQSHFRIWGSLLDSLHHYLQLTQHLKQLTLRRQVNDSVVKLAFWRSGGRLVATNFHWIDNFSLIILLCSKARFSYVSMRVISLFWL